MKKSLIVVLSAIFLTLSWQWDKGMLQSQLAQLEVSLSSLSTLLPAIPAKEPVFRRRNQFFFDVMDIQEAQFMNDGSKVRDAIGKVGDDFILKNAAGKIYHAGHLELLSIKELREKSQALPMPGGGTFNVIEAIMPRDKSYLKYVDVGAMQADPPNKDAVFQVASNFNCLELVGSWDPMTNITGYINDPTQGPSASISAAPGLIYRHYYYYYNPTTDPLLWRQTVSKQINLLDATDIPVTNSYVNFSKKAPADVVNANIDDIKVGFHQNEQVTFGFKKNSNEHELVERDDQIIHQVFTAAVDFGSNAAFLNDSKAQEIAQAVLDAAYEGTLRAAAVSGKKNVFLTLIGGGVFANPFEWIASAIAKNKQFIIDADLKVTLIIYDGSRISQTDTLRTIIPALVKETGGTYTRYDDQHPDGYSLKL